MKSFDWIKNRFDIQFGMPAFLYLCGVLLYAAAWFFQISPLEGAGTGKNIYTVDSRTKPFFGLIFAPLFFIFTIPAVLKFLKGCNKRDRIAIVLMLWLVYDVISVIIGAINGNSLRYLFRNTFSLSIMPLSYFFVRNYIKEDKQIKTLFYFMLILQFTLLSFPIRGFTAQSTLGIGSFGFYTFPNTEIFVTTSLLVLATLSRNRWIYITLLVAVLPALFSRTLQLTYFLGIFTVMAIIFFIHITEKGFIKRFTVMLLTVFISTSLFWNFGFIDEAALYPRSHSLYSKLAQAYTSVYTKIKGNIIKEEKAKGIEVPAVKVAQEEKAKGVEVPAVKVASVRKIVEVIGEGKYEIESTIKKVGHNSLKLIKTNPDPGKHFYARIRTSDDYDRFYFGGRKITFGAWVFSPTGEKVILRILDFDSDGVQSFADSQIYYRSGKWEFLTVSKEIRSRPEVVQLLLLVDEDGVYYVDGGIVVEGEIEGHKLSAIVNPDNDLFENFEVYAYPAMDQAINQRIYETRVVMEKLKTKPLSFLFGYGNGAVIDLSRSPDPTIRAVYGDKIKAVHSIHLLLVALLYRNGVIGLTIFSIFCVVLIVYFISMIKYFKIHDEGAIITEVLFLNVFMMILVGIMDAAYISMPITTGFCLGLIGVIRQNLSSSKATVK